MSQVLHSQGQRFRYVYDYGDNWEHEIVVEEISEPKEYAFYPVCLEGERACPPEDCGRVTGYDKLLGALREDSNAYLVPEYDSTEQAMRYIERNHKAIFEWELWSWYTDESVWPKKLTPNVFRK